MKTIMKANNSKYTMFAKRVATMVVAMFMGVTAWGADLTIDVTFTSNVLSLKTSGGETSEVSKTTGGYTYKLYGYNSCYYTSNKIVVGKTGAYITFPVVTGKKLTKVTFTPNSQTGGATFSICPANSTTPVTGGGSQSFTNGSSTPISWTLTGTASNTAYRAYNSANSNAHISSWSLEYTNEVPHTITFDAGTGSCGTTTTESVLSYVLPEATPSVSCASEEWVFLGWAASKVTSSTTTAPTIVGKAGDTYYPDANVTLYAVYMQATNQLATATFNASTLSGLTKESEETNNPAQYKHDDSGIKLYINYYGLYDNTWDFDDYSWPDNSWGYIQSSSNIQSISINYSGSTKLDHVDQDAGTATLSANKQTIDCTGDVKKVYLYPPSEQESQVTAFTVTYYVVNYWSIPSCCDKIVELSKGTETNATISSFTPESVPTCGADGTREVTIVVAANTGYKFNNGATLSYEGAGTTATLVSATNGTAPYTWVYRLAENVNGDGFFSVTSATPKNYAITLNGNGATTEGTASVNATFNSATLSAAITNPKKTDYIFQGWNTANDGSGLRVIDAAGALIADRSGYTDENGKWIKDGTAELYAEWNEHSYINYRTNCCTEYEVALANSGVATGGTFEASKTSACEGKEVTLTATPGTGYAFDAWTVMQGETDITSTKVAGNVLTMPAGNVTVEAAFSLIEYGITYHLNGGTNHANNPASYYYTSDAITLEDPSYAGHAFLGWYDNSNFEGDAVTTIPAGSTGAIELWANWIVDTQRSVEITPPSNGTITVSWNDGSDHSFSTGSQNIEIGTELTIEATGATGYDAGTITVNGTPLVGSTYELGYEALTIAAQFTIHNYSITYNLDGGTNHDNNPDTYTITSSDITLGAPTKTGYSFQGWYKAEDMEDDDNLISGTAIASGSHENKIFWAKWSKNSYTLTWNLAGGTVTEAGTAAAVDATGSPSAEVPYGDPVSAPTVTKTGYTFNGWNATPVTSMPAEAKTYTATWTKNNYHVYFQNNGVTINEYTRDVAYEAQIGALPDGSALVACDGSEKVFKGWTTTKIEGTQDYAPEYASSTLVMGAEDLYLYAVFAAEGDGPVANVNVFATTSLGNTNTVTSGYTISAQEEVKAESGYYKDGSSGATKRWVQVKKNNTSSAMISTTPKTVTVTARLGGGTAKDPLGNSVCAIWLDASGNELGEPVVLTNAITVAGGFDFSANLPVANATSAYGVRVYHTKESSYNVNYYSISLAYTIASVDYSDYMTHCCSLVAVENLAAVDNTSDTEVTLNWTALSSANQEGVTKLQVVDAGNNVVVDGLAASANTATITELTKCDTYSFRVATVGASCTTYSEAVEARPFGSPITVTFDNNYEGGAVTSESTTCDEDEVALATPDSREGYRFMGWFNGDIEVTDDPYTPTATVTLKAHWAQEYTLHYDYNGAAGAPDDAKYIAGETVTLPADPVKNYMSPFQEWSFSTDVTVTDGTFPMPASNLTVTAVFGGLQGQWFLVTNESELQANDKVIIAAKESANAMSTTQNSNNRGKTGITKKGNVIYSPADAVQIFELEAVNTGTWAFKCLNGDQANNYLYAASSSGNHLKSQNPNNANGEWDLDITAGKATAQGTNGNNVMRYNTNSSLFSCYGSATQDPIAFYRFVEGTFYEVTLPNAQDVTGGTITSDQVFVKAGETVTLTYTPKRGYTVGTLTVTGASGSVAVSPALEAGVTEYTFTMPAEGVTVAATFTALPPVVYHLLENVNDIVIGQQFVFVGTKADGSEPYVAGDINGGRLIGDDVIDGALNTTDKTLSLTAENAVDYVLDGVTGAYKIKNNNMYLKHGNSSGSVSWDDAGSAWTIAINDGKATIVSGDYTFQYNVTSHWYTAYTTASQQPVYIYTLSAETYNLQFQEENNTVIKTIEIAEGYTYKYTIKDTDVPSVIPTDPQATYEFAGKWSDGTNKYGTGDVVTVSAGTILKPCWKVTPSANKDINTLPTSVTEIVVLDGKTLNVDEERSLDNLTVEAGGKVSGSSTLNVNNLTIESEPSKSGQVTSSDAHVNGDIYLDIKLLGDGTGTMTTEESQMWYCISAPFEVSFNDGFFWGNGTQMGHNVDFQAFVYDGAKRASNGTSGWQRAGGKMEAGKAYLIGFDDERSNQKTIRLKAMSNTIPTASALPTEGHYNEDNAQANWNGVGNPTLHYIALDGFAGKVQCYNNGAGYSPYDPATHNYVVGTALFMQADDNIDLKAATNANFRAPKRESEENESYSFCVEIAKEGATRCDNRLYVSTSDEATSTYEQGKDMQSMNGTSAKFAALIWTENYGMRLASEDVPMVNQKASYTMGIYAPKAGTYSISAVEASEDAELYLTYNGRAIWNLSMSECELELAQGQNAGYGLRLVVKAPSVVTGVDEVQSDNVQCTKVIIDEHVYILRGGQMYDMTGKMVK